MRLAFSGEAMESCTSLERKDTQLEAANLIRDALVTKFRDRYGQWNRIAEELKGMTVPLVNDHIERVVKENALPEAFSHSVHWHILHACIETEYSDIVQPRFYTELARWYINGHFPCGWDGQFPEGFLKVY